MYENRASLNGLRACSAGFLLLYICCRLALKRRGPFLRKSGGEVNAIIGGASGFAQQAEAGESG